MNLYVLTYVVEFLVFLLLFVFLNSSFVKKRFASAKFYKNTLLLILIIQIISIALIKKEVGDVALFSSVGYIFRHGQDIYYIDKGHGSYPFFPFLIFFDALANFITESIKLFTFSFYLKLLLLVPLYFISFQIKNNAKTMVDGRILQLQFLTLPVVYTTILFHGQTDIMLIGFFFLASYFAFREQNFKNAIYSGLSFGASIATKTWSIFLIIPLILKQKTLVNKLIAITCGALFIFVDVFIYTRIVHSAFRLIYPAILNAGGGIEYWGITRIMYLLKIPIPNVLIMFLVLFGFLQILIFIKKFPFWLYTFLTVLSFYFVITRWGVQYILWIFPFIFMAWDKLNKTYVKIYMVISFVYTFFAYLNIASDGKILSIPIIAFIGLTVWAFGVFWFLKILYQPKNK